MGHGNTDRFTGQNYDRIFQTCNCGKLIGRDCYLMSCMTAQSLGSDIITKGGIAYQGYWISYTFVIESDKNILEADNKDKAFCDTMGFSEFLYARTATVKTCFELRKELSRLWVKFWELEGDGDSVINWLTHDELTEGAEKDAKLYGDETRRRTATISHRPAVVLIRKPTVEVGEDRRVTIAVACPQKCDLNGMTVKLLDQDGNPVVEKTLMLFQNGLYWTDFFTIQFTTPGTYAYKAVFVGDETHPAEESLPMKFFALGSAIVKGTITEEKTGEPIHDAFIEGGGKGTYTDVDGNYSLTVAAPDQHWFQVSKAGYENRTTVINVEPDQTYTWSPALSAKVMYTLTVNSEPSGLKIEVDWNTRTTPYIQSYWEGRWILLDFPTQQTKDGIEYIWSHWKEDGHESNSRWIQIMDPTTLTGIYTGGPTRKGQAQESLPITVTIHPRPEQETTAVTLTFDKTEYTSGETMQLSGNLSFETDKVPLSGRTIDIYENGTKIASPITDAEGNYALTRDAPTVETDTVFTYEAKFGGDA